MRLCTCDTRVRHAPSKPGGQALQCVCRSLIYKCLFLSSTTCHVLSYMSVEISVQYDSERNMITSSCWQSWQLEIASRLVTMSKCLHCEAIILSVCVKSSNCMIYMPLACNAYMLNVNVHFAQCTCHWLVAVLVKDCSVLLQLISRHCTLMLNSNYVNCSHKKLISKLKWIHQAGKLLLVCVCHIAAVSCLAATKVVICQLLAVCVFDRMQNGNVGDATDLCTAVLEHVGHWTQAEYILVGIVYYECFLTYNMFVS